MHILPRSAGNLIKVAELPIKRILAALADTVNRKLDPFILYYYFTDAI